MQKSSKCINFCAFQSLHEPVALHQGNHRELQQASATGSEDVLLSLEKVTGSAGSMFTNHGTAKDGKALSTQVKILACEE